MQEKLFIKNNKIIRNILLFLITLILTIGAFIFTSNKITVYADYSSELIKPLEYYNDIFKDKTVDEIYNNYNLELMQRMFVQKIGYSNLVNLLNGDESEDYTTMITWLYNDKVALKDFVTGGTPNGGNYIKALKVLTRLYKEHSSDLSDTTALFEPETDSTRNRGDVYRTMMISIALTNAKDVYGWVNSKDILDPLARYDAFKYTYLATDYHLRYDIFENLCVEEMRYLMSSRINSEEIYWLNAYATIKYGSATYPNVYSPHRHIRYGRDWDYDGKGYYKEENFEQYNQKYMLEQFGVQLTTTPRLWMAMEGSQICWGISYLGTNFASAFGVPSHYVRQPDHAAFLVYNKDSNGRSVWSIDNDIFGWTKTWMNEDTVGNGNNRMMCDWGTTGSEQVKHYNATYILLAQTALDDQENYEKAELLLSLDDLVSDKESLYRKVLTVMPYHFDAWYNLVKLYINNEKTDTEITTLAEELAGNMYYFPLPMHELITLLKNKLSSRNTESSLIQLANVSNIDTIALKKGVNSVNDENAQRVIAQTNICKIEANYLLGLEENTKLVTFSFDGENKNKLIFNTNYSSVRYKYSLDNGLTWSESLISDTTKELTATELDLITYENDILIWLDGWGTINSDKAYRIDILQGSLVKNIESNDNENAFLGTFDNLEYSLDEVNWQDLTSESYFEGDKVVYVRNKKFNTTLSGEITTFTFTNNVDENRKYIPISKITLNDFSSEEASQKDYAKHIIDGKLSTRWHTLWKGGDYDRYITVEFDDFKYISGIDYTPVGGNGTMLGLQVFVSTNGTDWTLAKNISGLANNSTKKQITFTPVYGKFVKIVGTNTVGGFASARLIEYFEDSTLNTKQIFNLELENLPTQDVYVKGQKINYKGLIAKIIFEDNTTAIIPNELLTLDDITFSQIGTHTITVKYSNNQTTFDVKVIDESEGVARIGENYYSSLENALLNISDGDTIELLKDVEVAQGYTITKKIIINGNNHTLTRKNDYLSAIITISGSGNLTLNNLIIDGGVVWSGEINEILGRGTTNSGIIATSPLIKMTDNSVLTLEGCTLQNNYNNYSTNAQNTGGAIFLGSKASATISNSIIKNCYSYLFGSAIYERDSAKLVINSGEITGNSGNKNKDTSAICIDNTSTCVVNGGNFYNNLANTKGGVFWVSNGSLEIDGGKFTNNYATNGAGIYLNGNAKVSIADFEEMQEIYLPSGKKIYIAGMLLGKTLNIKMANSANDTVVAVCEEEELKYKVLKAINVTNKVLYVDGNDIKIGDTNLVSVSIINSSKEILFTDLIQAINCAENGDVLTLKNNIILNSDVYIEKLLTIDLSNYYIEGIENIKTQTLCKVSYSNNLIEICNHSYNFSITYTFSEDDTTCTATGYCECGEEYTEISTTSENVVYGVHTGEETTTKIAKFEYNKFITQEKVVSEIVKPHIYNNNITYTFSEDYSSCTATGYCECGEAYSETVSASKQVTTNATCETEEISTFTASFSLNYFETQIKENVKTSDKLSHNFTDVSYVKPTCKQNGIKQHKHCSLCNKNFSDNEIVDDVTIAKIIHSTLTLNNITYTFSVDYSSCTATGYCECGEAYSETVSASKQVTTNATCETEEISTFTASFSLNYFETQIKENIKTSEKLTEPNDSGENNSQNNGSNQNNNSEQNNKNNQNFKNKLLIILIPIIAICILVPSITTIIILVKKKSKK